ncbi:MAG: lipoyl synthase [Candidatus Omnitrophica bacterium]|nr:lipoyl synthase [Candidatus Omnitrophota bacterium]
MKNQLNIQNPVNCNCSLDKRLPNWLNQDIPNAQVIKIARDIANAGVNTVCLEAKCPNVSECFKGNQATFLILGKICTRNCSFCNIEKAGVTKPDVDYREAERIIEVVRLMGLRYVVVTSVTRDDLDDGGSFQFASILELIHEISNDIKVEVLVPDFQGRVMSLKVVIDADPFVLAHNIETVKRLYAVVRPQADYSRSLNLLKIAKEFNSSLITKSSLMLGMGETEEEVFEVMHDLRRSNCDILTLGQYLAPSVQHYSVKDFIHPEQFSKYQEIAIKLGFKKVLSGPKVRSSYKAEETSRLISTAN